jgi:hypothetical protein
MIAIMSRNGSGAIRLLSANPTFTLERSRAEKTTNTPKINPTLEGVKVMAMIHAPKMIILVNGSRRCSTDCVGMY